MILVATGVTGSQQLARVVLKTLGYNRKNRVLVLSRPSSAEIIATAASLDLRARYEAQGRCFSQSMRFPLDETVGASMGIRRAGRPSYVRSNANRRRTHLHSPCRMIEDVPLTSSNVHQLDNLGFHQALRV